MATHSSPLVWKIAWTEEAGRLQSMGSLRVGHNRASSVSSIGEGNGNPLQYSCLENPRDRGAWWAADYGVAQSQTQLKWLSSSSSISGTYHPFETYFEDEHNVKVEIMTQTSMTVTPSRQGRNNMHQVGMAEITRLAARWHPWMSQPGSCKCLSLIIWRKMKKKICFLKL